MTRLAKKRYIYDKITLFLCIFQYFAMCFIGTNQILNSALLSTFKVALKKEADEALAVGDKKETAKITEESKDAPLAKQEV